VGGLPGGYDFSCSPKNLVIGGGCGEHPALVIHHLECLVAKYLLHDITMQIEHFADRGYVEPTALLTDRLSDILYTHEQRDILEFCGWTMSDTHQFMDSAKSRLHNSPLKDKQSVEDWIL
jgi:hypothetical protein